MNNSFEKNSVLPEKNRENDEFFVIRHSLSEYKLNEQIVKSEDPESAPSADKQWFNKDLSPEGVKFARENAEDFFKRLNPQTDALFFSSSDLVRAAETAKIYLDVAREKGFEILSPKERKDGVSVPKNKTDEIGEGQIRKIDCLALGHLSNMLREQIFQKKDYLSEIQDLEKVSAETREKWQQARAIIEADNRGSWGENYAAHSEEIQKIFPDVKSAKDLYESKFHDILRLIRFGQDRINRKNPEKNIKVLAFSHENSFLYFLKNNFNQSMKNCESIAFKVDDREGSEKRKIKVSVNDKSLDISD